MFLVRKMKGVSLVVNLKNYDEYFFFFYGVIFFIGYEFKIRCMFVCLIGMLRKIFISGVIND